MLVYTPHNRLPGAGETLHSCIWPGCRSALKRAFFSHDLAEEEDVAMGACRRRSWSGRSTLSLTCLLPAAVWAQSPSRCPSRHHHQWCETGSGVLRPGVRSWGFYELHELESSLSGLPSLFFSIRKSQQFSLCSSDGPNARVR